MFYTAPTFLKRGCVRIGVIGVFLNSFYIRKAKNIEKHNVFLSKVALISLFCHVIYTNRHAVFCRETVSETSPESELRCDRW